MTVWKEVLNEVEVSDDLYVLNDVVEYFQVCLEMKCLRGLAVTLSVIT